MSRPNIVAKWGVQLVASKGLDLICMDTYQSRLLGITKPHKEVLHFGGISVNDFTTQIH